MRIGKKIIIRNYQHVVLIEYRQKTGSVTSPTIMHSFHSELLFSQLVSFYENELSPFLLRYLIMLWVTVIKREVLPA